MRVPPEGFATAAEALVGTPFRLHGRDPASGLDCIGLVAAALGRAGGPSLAPTGYALRNASIAAWLPFAAQAGLIPTDDEPRRGDVLLLTPGPAQHHLAIVGAPRAMVHAHAGLRRVVAQPFDPDITPARIWRLSAE